jgi:[ribosomal protein S18]-alanine N-acetyltransferase
MSHVVDEMTLEDLPAVLGIDALSFPPASSASSRAASAEERYREELARPWAHLWVVRNPDGRAIAFSLAWHVADELHILNVATHPSEQRRGIGASLVAAAIDFARARRTRQVFLEARRSNGGAIRLYRSAGFFVLGIRRRYYPDDEDAVEMALLLDPSTGEVLPRADETRLDD